MKELKLVSEKHLARLLELKTKKIITNEQKTPLNGGGHFSRKGFGEDSLGTNAFHFT